MTNFNAASGTPQDQMHSVLKTWLTTRVEAELTAVPDRMWHYTSAAGLKGIFETQSLWATNTAFLNDTSEFSYGVGMLLEALADEDRSHLKESTRGFITNLLRNDGAVFRHYLSTTVSVFVTCLCAAENQLSQWRAYTGPSSRTGGYALGFETKSPHGWIQTAGSEHDLRLRQVIYLPDEQRKLCRDLVHGLVEAFDRAPQDVGAQKAFARCLEDGLIEFASSVKHPDFSEEKEWRVIYQRATDRDPLPLKFREADGVLVPYVELRLPEPTGARAGTMPVRYVQFGPNGDPVRTELGLRTFLGTYDPSIKITGSRTPAR